MKVLQIGMTKNHGGVESFVLNYARRLHSEDVIFDYVDLYGQGLAKEEEILSRGSRIYTLQDFRRHPLAAAKRIRKIVRSGDYCCVHVNMLSLASPVAVLTALASGANVIMHSHNTRTVGIHRKLLHAVNSLYMRHLPVTRLACGAEAGKWMFGAKPFTVIPNAVDVTRYQFDLHTRQTLRSRMGLTDDTLVLGFVGRFSTQKNPMYLLRILGAVKKCHAGPVKLLTIGEGELKAEFLKQAEEKGLLADVVDLGFREDTADWYSAMDAFVLPSLFEGLPLVGIEAQTSGVHCFFCDRITEELALTDRSHFCSLTDSAENWAEAILKTLKDNTDRQRYAQAVDQTDYGISHSAKTLLDIYTNCRKPR